MKHDDPATTFYTKPGYRVVSSAFGALLVGAGAYVLVTAAPITLPELLGGGVLVILGSNHLMSARAGKEPWLSKIGPLP